MIGTKHEVVVGDFYQIVNNKHKKFGVTLGDYVYIAGSSYVQEDERDPHNFRKKFVVAKTDNSGHVILDQGFLLDAKSLGIIPSYEQERLKNVYKEDFEEAST